MPNRLVNFLTCRCLTQQDAIVINDRHQLPDARAPNREVRQPDRPANPSGQPAAPTEADAWRERKRERAGLYNTVIGRYLADARAMALAHDTENARSPLAIPAAEDVVEPFLEIPYVPAPNREVRQPNRPATPGGHLAALEPRVLNPRPAEEVAIPAVEDAIEIFHGLVLANLPAPNFEVRRPDRPANPRGHPAAREPVLLPRLLAEGRGVGVPVVGGAGRAPADAAIPRRNQYVMGIGPGGNHGATPGVGAARRPVVGGAGATPPVAATTRRIQAELEVVAAGNRVAMPGAVAARRGVAITPAVGVSVAGGAELPAPRDLNLAEEVAAADAGVIEVATPASAAIQQTYPIENAEAETIPARPASPFSQLNFDQKIQHLLNAADEKIKQAEDYDRYFLDVVTTEIGSRNLTAKGCLGFALELALENRREQVPDISLRLARILIAEGQTISLFGVDFSRARIEAWSKAESLPEPIQVRQEFINKDGELGNRYGEDVHNRPVVVAGNKQLEVMANRTPAGSKKTAEETDADIRRYIETQQPSALAMAAFNRIMQRNGAGEFNKNFSPVLAIVWGYIEQCIDQEIKQNLLDSMLIKFDELGREWPCPTGVIQRIADIPTAIDLSLPQDIPDEEIFTELAKMAGDINASFEDDNAFNCRGSREEAGPDENSPARIAVEAAISALKRDMFLAKARVELVLLRNIDANFVMTAAERVFPKGSIL